MKISDRIRHFFHVVSNIRPIVWICLYICLTPVFALIYWVMPYGQFRIPDGAATDFGSWLYYSIVTITTLGFGDYTPAHGWAQAVTAIEVVCGLSIFGFFLNAVGSMKSEIDVASEIAKQKKLHEAAESEKLQKSAPSVMHNINTFLAYCYAVTTPKSRRNAGPDSYNPDFTFSDMTDMFRPSGLPIDRSNQPAVVRMLKCAGRTSLFLDTMEGRIDMSLWPELMEDCFAFVANYQLFASADLFERHTGRHGSQAETEMEKREDEISAQIASWLGPVKTDSALMAPSVELYHFIKENGALALKIEAAITRILEH